MTGKIRPRSDTHWETIGVSALPTGWRNTFGQGDDLTVTPCPALLLQEDRGTTRSWDEPEGDHFRRVIRFQAADPPYETRVVFADFDPGMAELMPADGVVNYAGTIGPGQEPAESAESAQ